MSVVITTERLSIRSPDLGDFEAINLLLVFINHKYGIRNFLIRPWIKNKNAIKAYKKCGFEEVTLERIFELYSKKNIEENGPGDYGEKETVNLYRYI